MQKVHDEWSDFLAKDASEHLLWQHPDIIIQKSLHHAYKNLLIVIIRQGGIIICIGPCIIIQKKFPLTFSIFHLPTPSVRILKILGNKLIYSRKANKKKCIEILFTQLKKKADQFDFIHFDNFLHESTLANFFNHLPQKKYNSFQLKYCSPKREYSWKHVLHPTYTDWIATLGKSTRRLIKRRINKLYKIYPNQVEFNKIQGENEVPTYLDLLNKLYPKTWQAKTFGARKRNCEADIAFFRSLAQHNWLRSYILRINGNPVAFFTGIQYNKRFEAIEIGYDSAFSSLGIGSALSYLVIQDLYNNDKPIHLDFGFGENKYKEMICTDKFPASEAYIIVPNMLSNLVRMQRTLYTLENYLRFIIIKFHIDNFIRSILKRKRP